MTTRQLDITRQLDVAVIGNVGLDINVFHPAGDIDFTREANFTENQIYLGHAGGYTSRGYAQLGWRTAFIGHVGKDFGGQFIRQELQADGIDITALGIDPAGTSSSVNLMLSGGRRKNFYDGKSHMELEIDLNTCEQIIEQARLAHFHLPNWARHLLPVARRLELTLACDLQDVVGIDDPYRIDFIQGCDILFFSAVNSDDDLRLLKDFLNTYPDKLFVMGRGSKGCAVGYEGKIQTFPALELEAPIVDTTGAGDALAVGFLTSFMFEKRPLEEAILRGQIAARHTCTQRATSSSLIRRKILDQSSEMLSSKLRSSKVLSPKGRGKK